MQPQLVCRMQHHQSSSGFLAVALDHYMGLTACCSVLVWQAVGPGAGLRQAPAALALQAW